MRRTFNQYGLFVSHLGMNRCGFTSIQPSLIAAPAQHFLSKSGGASRFRGGCWLVKVMGETEAPFATPLPGQHQERQVRPIYKIGRSRSMAGFVICASAIIGGAR